MLTANTFGSYYAEYCIQRHKVYYVAMVFYLMTLLMNNFTSIVIDDWISDEIHANY